MAGLKRENDMAGLKRENDPKMATDSSFEFYKKPAKKPLFLHHQSAMPTKSKLNFIRNERKRI